MTRIAPASGKRSPIMHSTVVVFPAPFGPKMPKISPSATENDTSSTATTGPYVLRRCETLMAASVAGLAAGTIVWRSNTRLDS